ncbi:MAG: hypothetical protein ACRDLL_10660 [Solirubrobacterales bacterium]
MTNARHFLATLGACLMASVALMACIATAAQAEPAEWQFEGKTMSELKLEKAPIVGELDAKSSLQISGTGKLKEKITLECSKLEIKNGFLLKGGTSTGEYLYSSCKTTISGKESKACKPSEPVNINQVILLILHGNDTKIFSLVDMNGVVHFGELCALAEEAALKGSVVFECPEGAEPSGPCETEQVSHLFNANNEVAEMFKGQEEEGQVLPDDEFFFLNNPAEWVERLAIRAAAFLNGQRWRGIV